ncbi:MAG: alpha-ketoglutarate-dependent dioxygenase AlkB, partial [Acidobacteria bacterium]|nr:alpha-ketoglutarate-dependent dioxygenase AlkB [Acidobacteriota bacterium]
MEIFPGAFHLPAYLDSDCQRELVAVCRSLWQGTPGPFVPTVRGGAKMRIQMLCLGRHWNALTYGYE